MALNEIIICYVLFSSYCLFNDLNFILIQTIKCIYQFVNLFFRMVDSTLNLLRWDRAENSSELIFLKGPRYSNLVCSIKPSPPG